MALRFAQPPLPSLGSLDLRLQGRHNNFPLLKTFASSGPVPDDGVEPLRRDQPAMVLQPQRSVSKVQTTAEGSQWPGNQKESHRHSLHNLHNGNSNWNNIHQRPYFFDNSPLGLTFGIAKSFRFDANLSRNVMKLHEFFKLYKHMQTLGH